MLCFDLLPMLTILTIINFKYFVYVLIFSVSLNEFYKLVFFLYWLFFFLLWVVCEFDY